MTRAILLTQLALAPAAAAWSPQTRVRIADEAVRFMPAGLRLALETHREDLLRGMLEPLLQGDVAERRPPWADGHLDRAVAPAAGELESALAAGRRFADSAARFGRVAHFVAESSFPPAAGTREADPRYADFSAFCESRRERFPLVFTGHEVPELQRDDYRAFALRLLQSARDDDRELARAYAAAGERPDPLHFDDRSVPFAIGSLAYSRAVSSVVQVWLTVWSKAGGDMTRTPYRGDEPLRSPPPPAPSNLRESDR
jgi:hypothetical protein